MKPTVQLTQSGGNSHKKLLASLDTLRKKQVYVGVPATTALARMTNIIDVASRAVGRRKSHLLSVAAKTVLNNAQLVYIHTHGSPVNHIPPRPIIEPAIEDRRNLALITAELKLAAEAALGGRSQEVTVYLHRTGLLAEGIVRRWFTDPKNHWAPNAPETIRRKGSERPLIDTAELRKSITYVVSEEV